MNVLLIGVGGREHAIAWKLRQSPRLTDFHIAPGNAGTAGLGHNVDLPVPKTGAPAAEVEAYLDAAVKTARDLKTDLVFVAPDDPLSWGLVDRLTDAGIPAFGPTKAAAEIEASKVWSDGLTERHDIPRPVSATFTDAAAAKAYLDRIEGSVVVKASGLAGGKGAIVTDTKAEAIEAIDALMSGKAVGDAGRSIVIQERLRGRETSAHAFTDGRSVRAMPLSCDHKTVFDNDQGPNTGGMGVYTPPWWLDAATEQQILRTITETTVAAMRAEGRPFKGILYPGIMVTEAGPRVIEYNARFGDPETQALLPRLKTDLLDIVEAVVNERLADLPIDWAEGASVCVVLASGGYPGSYRTGLPITGIEDVDADVQVFHAGTRRDENGALVTAGGRVLSVVATAPSLTEAREKAYRNAERIQFEGRHFRRDIAAGAS